MRVLSSGTFLNSGRTKFRDGTSTVAAVVGVGRQGGRLERDKLDRRAVS